MHAGQNGSDERHEFQQLQIEHFAGADEAKFAWQTTNPYLKQTEGELLSTVRVEATDRLLEVGCGEGANLEHLRMVPARTVGVDFSSAKVCWAQRRHSQARFVCSDAASLPFRDGYFDVVLCRDVLHHVADKPRVVAEMIRVCRSRGLIVIIEPNGYSPIMRMFGLLVRAERDLVRNSVSRLTGLLVGHHVETPRVARAQPFPLGRALFHYKWGLPGLSSWLGGLILGMERLLGRLSPSGLWGYIIIEVLKRDPDPVGVSLSEKRARP